MIAEKIKLNLGARDRTARGFKNMDIDHHPGVDYVGDVSDADNKMVCLNVILEK